MTMAPIKYFSTVAVLLSVSAISFGQDHVKIEPKWEKDFKAKLTHKFDIELDQHKAKIDAQTVWSATMAEDGYTLTIHHDALTIVADENEVTPPYEDYKVVFDKKSSVSSISGGINGSNALRMFLVGHFFAPANDVKKDEAVKWELPPNTKIELGTLKIQTTFLGSAEVGKFKGYKFKQVVSEEGGEFATEGTYTVTADGHLLKAEVTFKGMPIPDAGGDAKGKFTATVVE